MITNIECLILRVVKNLFCTNLFLFTCLDECCWVFSVLWYFDLFKILLASLLLFMFCHMHVLNKNLMAEKKNYQKIDKLL